MLKDDCDVIDSLEAIDYGFGTVGRAVINNYQFDIWIGLTQDAVDSLFYVRSVVIICDVHTDERLTMLHLSSTAGIPPMTLAFPNDFETTALLPTTTRSPRLTFGKMTE